MGLETITKTTLITLSERSRLILSKEAKSKKYVCSIFLSVIHRYAIRVVN